MKIINATGFEEITEYLSSDGLEVVESYDVYESDHPIIVSYEADPSGSSSNLLANSGADVLYLTASIIPNLHKNITILSGDEIEAEDILLWVKSLIHRNTIDGSSLLTVKKTVLVYPMQTGVGSAFISRLLAWISSKERNTVLLEANYRYPKSMHYLGLSSSENSLDKLVRAILSDEGGYGEVRAINKASFKSSSRDKKKAIKHLPDNLYLLAPDPKKNYEHFPELPSDISVSDTLAKDIISYLKTHHESSVINPSSDLDDPLTLSLMKKADVRVLVVDTSPASMLTFEKNLENLQDKKLYQEGDIILINKCIDDEMQKQIEAKFYNHKLVFLPFDHEVGLDMLYAKFNESGDLYKKLQELESRLFGTILPEKKEKRGFFKKRADK